MEFIDVVRNIPVYTEESRLKLLNTYKKKFGGLRFYKVAKVHAKKENFWYSKKTYVEQEGDQIIQKDEYCGDYEKQYSEKEMKQNVTLVYKEFSFETSFYNEECIKSTEKYYKEINIIDGTFRVTSPEKDVPLPLEGDLVCGKVKRLYNMSVFQYWFICTDQFYHFHRAVMNGDERYLLQKGNYICPNSYKKWSISQKENGLPITLEEAKHRFWRNRSENNANYVHLYSALLTMMYYGEVPDTHNMPINLRGPNMSKWDIPEGWVQMMEEKYELKREMQERDILVAVPRKYKNIEEEKVLEKKDFLLEETDFPEISK